MLALDEIKPTTRQLVMDLAQKAGIDVSDWGKFKGGPTRAATNPKYCYEWSFVQGEKIVLNLWHNNMLVEDGKIIQRINMRTRAKKEAKSPNEIMWKSRSSKADDAIQTAYRLQLPIRVIVCDGERRVDNDNSAKASTVSKRLLDSKPWAVVSYDMGTGDCILGRDVTPAVPSDNTDHEEAVFEGFEGETKERFALHRKREGRFRYLKIRDALRKNDGRLLCEVPNCGFDFALVYGAVGEGYAEVHHKVLLSEAPIEGRKVVLEDLAVVCSNCHAMIHRGGECRPLETLIPAKRPKE